MTLLQNLFAQEEIGTCPQLNECNSEADDGWAERSRFWIKQAANSNRPRRKRERNPNPLILCGHGVSLRIEHGALVIRDGFTHYPQTQATYRFFPRDLDLPTRIILLDGSGSLSFEVLTWLCQQGVSLARVSWTGDVAAVASGAGYAADPDKLQWQHQTRADQGRRFQFAAEIIRQKLAASLETLERIPDSRSREIALSKAAIGIERLEGGSFTDMNEIFAIEGECASAYFAAWHGLEMQWKGLSRRPVPTGWQAYFGRSSLATGVKAENRNASHPLNAMLNYAYGVKLAALQVQAIADGYDPTFGIMHNGKRRGSPAFVLDLIEPKRPRVDAAILKLVAEQKFAAADFIIRPNGSCRLAPQLARAVAALALQ